MTIIQPAIQAGNWILHLDLYCVQGVPYQPSASVTPTCISDLNSVQGGPHQPRVFCDNPNCISDISDLYYVQGRPYQLCDWCDSVKLPANYITVSK